MPAHYCGIAALKPNDRPGSRHGRLRARRRLTDPRSQVGPMARFVSDLASSCLSWWGRMAIDSGVVPVPLAKRTPKLKSPQVAWYAGRWNGQADARYSGLSSNRQHTRSPTPAAT